jgi:hypothetical protein
MCGNDQIINIKEPITKKYLQWNVTPIEGVTGKLLNKYD